MLRNFVLGRCAAKIQRLKPEVKISLNKELPLPSLKEVSRYVSIVAQVNALEKEIEKQPDIFFKEKTDTFRKMIADRAADLNPDEQVPVLKEVMEEILPYYFAMVREAGKRTIRMRHFDVQILGGIMLNNNKIAEMVTGEGKTLVATLPAALNALAGRGVHVVTVNDYLARRDMEWMGPLYQYLGFSVGVIQQDMDKEARRYAYGCDITYGTNNEFGFDYLRDNMVTSKEAMAQRGHFFAIVDEVDSILVDEARTPLIISGPAELSTDKYYQADKAVRQLKVKFLIQSFDNTKEGIVMIKNRDGSEEKVTPEELDENYDAIVEEKTNNAYLTSRGERRVEQYLGIKSVSDESPDALSNPWVHYITQSLRAHNFFHNDREYIVKDGKVIIVDEFTGRLMPGRRWSDGLHQAVEAKESMRIQEESQTLATITLQNYFRMYKKLAGMTGTAYTEANEFRHIYNLDVVAMPTNRPLIRRTTPDRIYKNKKGKFEAVIKEIEEVHAAGRPVLVGTTSIEDSELLSFLLGKKGIPHNVLNAKYHEKEAYIVAQAGRPQQVTIATNMAGRGTDIILGGNLDYFIKDLLAKNEIAPEDPAYKEQYEALYQKHKDEYDRNHQKVVDAGGLHIVGTQRHEARRIDNQLRGRAGRQGDPGSSRFYVSLEDDLMRLFGSEKLYQLMDKMGFPEDEPIEHPWVTGSLEMAQKRVEAHNFEIRKDLLKYDDVMNKQREVIYKQRQQILEGDNFEEELLDMIGEVIEKNTPVYLDEERNILGLQHWAKAKFGLELSASSFNELSQEQAVDFVKQEVDQAYQRLKQQAGQEQLDRISRFAALWVVDLRWKEHLLVMDSLKEGMHWRGYAQVDPLVEYQRESYAAFDAMVGTVREGIVDLVFKTKITMPEEAGVFTQVRQHTVHSEYSPLHKKEQADKPAPAKPQTVTHEAPKVGRNDPCPCGSGKKYKKCCGS